MSYHYIKLFIILVVVNLYLTSLAEKNRVILIGIDGLLKKCMDTNKLSFLKYMEQNGSYTYSGRTSIQAVSGPGWSNILCGMDTESSGVVRNEWEAPWLHGKAQPITPLSGNEKPLPCIFEQIKKENKDLKTAAIFSWDWFENLSNKSIHNSIDMEEICHMDSMEEAIVCDEKSIDKVKKMITNDFDFLFWYIASLDETGHATKFCSETYIDRLSAINGYIEEIVAHLKEEQIFENTYIIVTTDHGASYMTDGHGDQNNDNVTVPWWIVGPKIKKGYFLKDYFKNYDNSKTILKILNIQPNKLWMRSRVMEDAFIKEQFLN